MDPEDRSLDDCDGPIASFHGATLQIQDEHSAKAVASLSVSVSQTSHIRQNCSDSVANEVHTASPSEIKSGSFVAYAALS